MEAGLILQIVMIAMGIFILCISVISLANNNMTVSFSLAWGGFSLIFIIAGIILRPTMWNRFISTTGLAIIVIVGACSIFWIYFTSCKLSKLIRQNNEISIQVSLLNAENEELEKRLLKLEQER